MSRQYCRLKQSNVNIELSSLPRFLAYASDAKSSGSEYVLQLCRPIGATQAIAKTCKERKPGKPFQVSAKRCGLWEMGKDVDLHVPSKEIPRVRYPEQLSRESFERDFAAKSEPVIIEGLVSDWPAFADPERNWRGCRWDEFMGNEVLDVGFDPLDGRMMHFGDDTGEPRPKPIGGR